MHLALPVILSKMYLYLTPNGMMLFYQTLLLLPQIRSNSFKKRPKWTTSLILFTMPLQPTSSISSAYEMIQPNS